MELLDELSGLVDALNAEGIDYAVCGGIAVAIHGHPRFTKDLDVLVQRADVDRIRAAARRCGFTLEGMPMLFGAGSKSEREILRLTKAVASETVTLDLLLVGPPLVEVWAARKATKWRGRDLWVVSREGLLHMKHLSGRPQDLVDIQALTRPDGGERDG